MKTIDGPSKLKGLILIGVLIIMIGACYVYHNYSVYKSIKVVTNDNTAIEYGSANYDIKKIVKEVDGDIVSIKKDADINTLGNQEVILEVKKDNIVKDVPIVVSIVDTASPIIQIDKNNVSITEGDSFDVMSNILSVNDGVDGELSLASGDNNSGNYTVEHDDLSKVGSHDIVVTAVDKSGNKTVSKFTLNVEAKPTVTNDTTNNIAARVNSDVNVPVNASGNDIVSIARRYVGYPYVAGANGPNAFDCSGFVQFVYSQVGKSVSRSSSTQYRDGVGVSYANAMPGDILSWGYEDGRPTHSALYIGNGMMIHATNPSDGVLLSNVAAWTSGSGMHVIAVRRIG